MALQTGQLGRYRVLSRLSVGGMAELFLAQAEGASDLVTVKRILPDLRERDEFVTMFVDEARISAALVHPNIARVYELGHDRDELFIAMEFIAGQSLASLLRRCQKLKRPVPMGFTARVGRELCRALECAHGFTLASGVPSPVIHRDVSPSNVMVTYEGEVKVIDFGVAKAAGNLSRTSTGNIKGSRGYMSPEQARGAPLDARSDIFSAGVVLHELLTGRPLFLRDSELMTFRTLLRDGIPTAISVNPGVPRALSEVVERALARAPDARYQSAAEFGRALATAIPSLLHSQSDAQAFMQQLFAQELSTTLGLLTQAAQAHALPQEPLLLEEPKARRRASTDVYGPLPTGVIRLTQLAEPEEEEVLASAEPAIEGASVLSVDDSVISREFISAHLESAGFPVLQAETAREALELVAQRAPDLILLDVRMPGVDGFELCRALRERCTGRPFLPILFCSAADSFEERLQGLEAGGDDFVHKPFAPAELVAVVRAHLKRSAFLEAQAAKARARRRELPSAR